MSRKRTVSAVIRRAKSAVDQRRQDRDFVAGGGHIIYAVDTNVVSMYADPANKVVDVGDKRGYTQFFKTSDYETSLSLGKALADFLFRELSQEIPTVIFDAHLTEVDDFVVKLALKANESSISTRTDLSNSISRLEALLEEETSQLTDGDDLTWLENVKRVILAAVPDLVSKLGSINEMKRLESLFTGFDSAAVSQPAVVSIPALSLRNSNPAWLDANVFRTPAGHIEETRFREVREILEKRLRTKKEPARSNDVDVLAKLYWINRAMLKNGDKCRLVLISADDNLVEASNMLSPILEKEFPSPRLGFGDIYIRHPQAFVFDDDFIGNFKYDLQNLTQVTQYLSGIVLEVKDLEDVDDLYEILRILLAADDMGRKIDSIVTEKQVVIWWDATLQAQLTQYVYQGDAPSERMFGEFIAIVRESENVRRSISEIVNVANNALIINANQLGLSTFDPMRRELKPRSGVGYRLVPYLRFQEWTRVRKFTTLFIPGRDFRDKIDELYNELSENDPSGYSALLCSSALWADRGRWDIAADNAGRALKIALEMDDKTIRDTGVFGHESAYMLETAKRYLVNDRTGVKGLRHHLELAERRWTIARDVKNDPSMEDAKVELRFRNAWASIELMKLLFSVFDEKDDLDAEKAAKLCVKLGAELQSIINASVERSHEFETEDNQHYCCISREQALHKLFTIMLLAKKYDALAAVTREVGDPAQYVKLYTELDLYDVESLFDTVPYLHAVTFLVAQLCFANWTSRQVEFTAAKRTVTQALSEEKTENHSGKRYDGDRFRYLSAIAELAQI